MKLTIFMRSQNHFDKSQKKPDLNYCFILEPNKINFVYIVRAQDVFELRLIKTNKSVSIIARNARVDQFLLFSPLHTILYEHYDFVTERTFIIYCRSD